jgi:hypothetical protein
MLKNKHELFAKKVQKNDKATGESPKDLPRWITGDLASTDQDDYFVSEDESEKRIYITLQIFITFLLITCCILVEKCFNNSNFSVKRRIIHARNGKYN